MEDSGLICPHHSLDACNGIRYGYRHLDCSESCVQQCTYLRVVPAKLLYFWTQSPFSLATSHVHFFSLHCASCLREGCLPSVCGTMAADLFCFVVLVCVLSRVGGKIVVIETATMSCLRLDSLSVLSFLHQASCQPLGLVCTPDGVLVHCGYSTHEC